MAVKAVTPDELRRLAFIKYLYGVAVEQSQQPDPMKAASVLTFHDAVELFLILAAQQVKINPASVNFMQFWERLETQHVTLGHKEPMRILNELRNSLKHTGIRPGSSEVEAARANVAGFFQENTPLAFDGLAFAGISMAQLVEYDAAKAQLEEAQRLMSEGSNGEAIEKIAIAFQQLLDDYHSRAARVFGKSSLDFHKQMRFESKFQGPPLPSSGTTDPRLLGLVSDLTDSVRQLQVAVTVLGLGLDYRRFAKYESLTPLVWTDPQTEEYVTSPGYAGDEVTAEDCRFCFDFVIESALRLQEFDFDTQ